MTPREPDRFEAIVDDWDRRFNHPASNRSVFDKADLLAYLRAAESSALERAAQAVENEDEGSHGMDYQLGDVSDFRARCVKAIGALKQSHERSNDEVADVELRMPSTAVDAADVGRDAPVPSRDKAPGHPAIRALIPPAAAPAADYDPITAPIPEGDMNGPHGPVPAAESGKAQGTAQGPWRVGNHYGIHVYEDQRPVATFLREEDARRCVDAVNGAAPPDEPPAP